MSWFLAFAGFAALIVLHEFGHFAAAKAVGMRVERFCLFFPPLIWTVRRGETEYGIGAIPLGGYVKITGMNPEEEIPPEVEHRAYYKQAVWKRIVVIAAGPVMNIIIAFLILWALFLSKGVGTGDPSNTVAAVEKGTPAAAILDPGDRLVAVDGVRGSVDRLVAQVGTHECPQGNVKGCRGTPVQLTVLRDGRTRTFTTRPFYDEVRKRPRLGFGFEQRIEDIGAGRSAEESVSAMWRVTEGTVSALARIFDEEKRKEISGVVGSYETARQSFDFDIAQALSVLSIISLSLAIVNLFPFLPLDGGHIFWAVAEKVRGRPIPFAIMERAGVFGFFLILMLFFVGLTNDIDRLRGEGFGIR